MDERGGISRMCDSSILPSWRWQAFRKFSVWPEIAWVKSSDVVFFLILFKPFYTFSFRMFSYLTRIPSLAFLRTCSFLPPASAPPLFQCPPGSLLCSLWISFTTPSSSFITVFSHLFSNLPSLFSEPQICISGPDLPMPSLNLQLLRLLSSLLLKLYV